MDQRPIILFLAVTQLDNLGKSTNSAWAASYCYSKLTGISKYTEVPHSQKIMKLSILVIYSVVRTWKGLTIRFITGNCIFTAFFFWGGGDLQPWNWKPLEWEMFKACALLLCWNWLGGNYVLLDLGFWISVYRSVHCIRIARFFLFPVHPRGLMLISHITCVIAAVALMLQCS